MSELYTIWNGPAPTTAAQQAVTTGTAIKTMLQVKLGTQTRGKLVYASASFDGSAAATPGKCEVVETGTIFGTVTASVAADIVKGDPNGVAPDTSAFIVGTTATGYTCTSEGSIVATRVFDAQLVAPSNQYSQMWPLGREPTINVSTALRMRVTFAAAINAICGLTIEL